MLLILPIQLTKIVYIIMGTYFFICPWKDLEQQQHLPSHRSLPSASDSSYPQQLLSNAFFSTLSHFLECFI